MELLINNLLLFSALLLFCLNWADVNGAPYYDVPVKSLLPSSKCVGSNGSGSAVGSQKLKVTNSYGPCSPLGHKKKIPSAYQDFSQDKARLDFINGRVEKLTATIDHSSSSYVVKIGFGTPKKEYTVTMDTGSDITWIQCLPCSTTCYSQKEQPMFDPSQSSSYTHGSCKPNSENTYNIQYGDHTYSNGFYGCDSVTFDESHGFPNFQFGCGQNNSDGFGKTAGMLGLGRGDISFVSQTASQFGKFFSYCIPPKSGSEGYLLFGDEARNSISSRTFTPLLKKPKSSFYFVSLTGITVGSKKLKVSASVFLSPGTIIDSGTVITRLPQSAYSALKSAFQKSMSRYPSVPAPAEEQTLDTCYDLRRYQKVMIPVVVLHFGGGTNVTLDRSGIITHINGRNRIFCLAFAAKKEGDLAIIGNTQQKGMEILYDLNREQIGFRMNGCNN